jgi:hypothetical protein
LSPAKPLKSLRLTIIAFVKNIEKKREKERLSAIGAETPATPITPVAPPTPTVASAAAVVDNIPEQSQNDDSGGAGLEPSNGMTAVDGEANVVESVEQPANGAELSAEQDVCTLSRFPLIFAYTSQNTNTDKPDDNDDDDTQSQASDETEIFTGEEQSLAQQNVEVEEQEQDQTGNSWSNMSDMYSQNYGYNDPNFQGMDFNAMQVMQQQMMLQMQNGGFPNNFGQYLPVVLLNNSH